MLSHGLFASPPGFELFPQCTSRMRNEEEKCEVCCGKVRPGRALQLCKTETATEGGNETTKNFGTKPGGAS